MNKRAIYTIEQVACMKERKARMTSKRIKKYWAKKRIKEGTPIEVMTERINDYCGTITMSQFKELNG